MVVHISRNRRKHEAMACAFLNSRREHVSKIQTTKQEDIYTSSPPSHKKHTHVQKDQSVFGLANKLCDMRPSFRASTATEHARFSVSFSISESLKVERHTFNPHPHVSRVTTAKNEKDIRVFLPDLRNTGK
jgi:CCR4-NOT transcriptional regulation complex NOT5 subunit